MGFFSRLFRRTEVRAVPGPDYLPSWFGMPGPAGYNDTGVTITEGNALISTTVWSCVSIVSQTIATLPVHVIRRGDGKKLYDHPLYQVLAVRPNEFMTPAVFREVLLANALLWGGAYAAIERDARGQVSALYPLRSSDVRPVRRGGLLMYDVRLGADAYTLSPDRVICLLGWSLDGITPLSPIRAASQAVGLAVAMERYAAKAFSGGNVGGILQTPPMSEDAMRDFIASWRKNYTGVDNAFRVAVLPEPFRFLPTTLDPEKGQLVESRQAQVLELCRLWKVPPSMLGILEKSSYASLEQQNAAFYQQAILPWLVKLEQELVLKGLLEQERPAIAIKFNADALLRASTQERYSAYMTGRQAGFLTINDIRRKENLPPVEGGDVLLQPLNMQAVGPVGSLPAKPDTSAVRSLIEDAARRVLTKEAKALQRAGKKYAGKPEELRAWAETWYSSHAQLVARQLAPSIRAAGLDIDAEEYARQHCERSLAAIAEALAAGTDLHDLADDWTECRPADITNHLVNKEYCNA